MLVRECGVFNYRGVKRAGEKSVCVCVLCEMYAVYVKVGGRSVSGYFEGLNFKKRGREREGGREVEM